jgi:osmoprotectant transport system substrate-binding protein
MRSPAMRWCGSALLLVLVGAGLVGCSSSKKTTTATTATTTVCTSKTGSTLAVLADDKHLEGSDNIIPVVNTTVAKSPLTDALNQVSAALTQTALIALNVAVETNREEPTQAASDFVSAHNLGQGLSGGSGSIKVTGQTFSENETLAYIAADTLTKVGYSTSTNFVAQREIYAPALESNQVQVVMDYAFSLATYLAQTANSTLAPSSVISQTVSVLKQLAAPKGLTVLNPAAATDENAYAVTQATATFYGLKTLSDLAAKCPGGVTLGGPANCPQRPECQPGLTSLYGLKITRFDALDSDGPLTRTALKSGKDFLGVIFSSDPDATPA